MLSPVEIIGLLDRVENIVAELDTIFNELLIYRSQGLFISRRHDKIILRIYTRIHSILQYIVRLLVQHKQTECVSANITSLPALNTTYKFPTNIDLILRRVYSKIQLLREFLEKLSETNSFLEQLNIIKRLDSEDAVLSIKDYKDFTITITARKIIIFGRKTHTLLSVVLEDIEDILYKKSFMFKGCEIHTRTGEVIRLPLGSDATYEIKKIIKRITDKRITRRSEYIKALKTKHARLHPCILSLKVDILRKLLSSIPYHSR